MSLNIIKSNDQSRGNAEQSDDKWMIPCKNFATEIQRKQWCSHRDQEGC